MIGMVCMLLMLSTGYTTLCARVTGRRPHLDTLNKSSGAYDKTLLNKFLLVCKTVDPNARTYTITGTISSLDKALPAKKMENVPFVLCKKEGQFYYRLGTTETINGNGAYLYIDHKARRVMLSAQKQVADGNGLSGLTAIAASLESENYKMNSMVKGDMQTISMINEYHVSCKEYAVTFNRRTLAVKRVYVRLSNSGDPLSKDKEKVIDVRITQWNTQADLSRYTSKNDMVKKDKYGWKMAPGYKSYKLVSM